MADVPPGQQYSKYVPAKLVERVKRKLANGKGLRLGRPSGYDRIRAKRPGVAKKRPTAYQCSRTS